MIGMVINDLLALLSVVGSTILLFGAFSKASLKRYGKIAEWSILGLIFGGLFQISMAVTGTTPEQIGIVFRMSTLMVNALLGVSLLMLIGRWAIRKVLSQKN
jgi:uncharacterized membrane protein